MDTLELEKLNKLLKHENGKLKEQLSSSKNQWEFNSSLMADLSVSLHESGASVEAFDFALLRAQQDISIDEHGKRSYRNKNGDLLVNADGGYTATDYVKNLQENDAAMFWPKNNTDDSTKGDSGNGGDSLSRGAFEAMNPTEQSKFISDGGVLT